MLYPTLRTKFGNQVTYADDSLSHVKTEFAFDVLQVAQGHYAPDAYHRFVGFQVARPVLERAFQSTYGLKLGDVFPNVTIAIGSFRYAIGTTLPAMTRVAWQMKKDEIVKDAPGTTKKKFLYNLSKASYHKQWGKEYQQPGFRSRMLAGFLNVMPRVGRSRALHFETPTPAVEKMFMASFNAALDRYKEMLLALQAGVLKLPNDNFDVGKHTGAGGYSLSDHAYEQLVGKLAGHMPDMPPELRRDILAYYGDLSAPISTKTNAGAWAKLVRNLDELKGAGDGPSLVVKTP